MNKLYRLRKCKIKELLPYTPVLNAGLVLYDLEKKCLEDSVGYSEQKTGFSFKELHTPGFYMEIIHPDDLKSFEFFHEVAQNLEDDEVIERTFRFRKKNNRYSWFHFKAMVFERNPDTQTPRFLLSSSVDVSDKIDIIKKLEEKNEQLETISYINAHEVRAPVASILGLLQLLSEQSFQSEADSEIFMHLKETVKQLDRIIKKISRETEK